MSTKAPRVFNSLTTIKCFIIFKFKARRHQVISLTKRALIPHELKINVTAHKVEAIGTLHVREKH